ncbi:MAG: hypothetical protein IJU76_11435 [Desulfovibrionaceae bacterium]|nr:hypothetical protein [Desulfovibrionaceae bacterium]
MSQVAPLEPSFDESRNDSKILTPVNASARANQLVKKKYNFETIELVPDKPLYILKSKSMAFDRILRRTPREVYKNSDDYTVPLGYTCTQTIISAYGLSNGVIYSEDRWIRLIAAFNQSATEDNAMKVVCFLRAAATLKYINVSGSTINSDMSIEFAEQILSVNDNYIISYFSDMIR